MEKYINESLALGIIQHSSSPLGVGIFFVSKKNGSVQPCIDCHWLNKITVKNRYPLPLIFCLWTPPQCQGFHKIGLSQCLSPCLHPPGGWVENSLQVTTRPLWISGYAFWTLQFSCCLSSPYKLCSSRLPQPVYICVHRQHTNLLQVPYWTPTLCPPCHPMPPGKPLVC